MDALRAVISAVMGDATPEERARVLRLSYRIAVTISLLWAFGWLNGFGLTGFAKADEVDSKIQSAVEPIRAQLGQITVQLSRGEEVQKRILQGQIAAQLRDLNRLRCSTSDEHMRMRMERDIEDAEQEYKTLTGERYPLPACKDL